MIDDRLLNPFDVDPALEFPHPPQDAENWTEYQYFFAYDPDQDVGMSLHIGRLVADLSIWRGILYIFLPGDEVLVRRCSGRGDHPRGVVAGPLSVICVDPFKTWTIDFDGSVQPTTGAALARDVFQDNIDEVATLHVTFTAATPLYSGLPDMGWAKAHTEQLHTVAGQLTYRGRTVVFSGMGNRDHSSGPRDSGKVYGGAFFNALFPSGRAVGFNIVRTPDYDGSFGHLYWGDGSPMEEITVVSYEEIAGGDFPLGTLPTDAAADLKNFEVVIATSRGEQTIRVERLRSISSTYVPPHHEVAGTDFSRPDAAQQSKIAGRATWDGELGTCQNDRFARIRFLRR